MSDPDHLHDLTDDEHRALEATERNEIVPLGDALVSLLDKGLVVLSGDINTITPAGQAIRDRVRMLATHITGNHNGAIYLWDDFELRTDVPLGRAVLRQWEADHV